MANRRQSRRSARDTCAEFPQAAALFRSRLQPLAESDPEIPINLSEVKLTCSFVAEVTATFKAVRHFLRANPAVQQQGCPYPPYSPDFELMIAGFRPLRTTEAVREVVPSFSRQESAMR